MQHASRRSSAERKEEMPCNYLFKRLGAAFVALALFGGQAVHAVPLPTPGVVVPPLLAGTLTTAGISQVATLDGVYDTGVGGAAGTYTARVFREGAGTVSPFGVGALSFAYQFTQNAGVLGPIERVTMSNFNGFLTDVVLDTTNIQGAGPAATRAANQATRDPTGNVVGFDYSGGNAVLAGQRTFTMVIRTNATQVIPGLFSFINGTTDNEVAFAPAGGVVPEPASIAMGLVVGAPLIGAAVRRKLKQSRQPPTA
jgi:hypothetical protein